jgi:hypothetical protein
LEGRILCVGGAGRELPQLFTVIMSSTAGSQLETALHAARAVTVDMRSSQRAPSLSGSAKMILLLGLIADSTATHHIDVRTCCDLAPGGVREPVPFLVAEALFRALPTTSTATLEVEAHRPTNTAKDVSCRADFAELQASPWERRLSVDLKDGWVERELLPSLAQRLPWVESLSIRLSSAAHLRHVLTETLLPPKVQVWFAAELPRIGDNSETVSPLNTCEELTLQGGPQTSATMVATLHLALVTHPQSLRTVECNVPLHDPTPFVRALADLPAGTLREIRYVNNSISTFATIFFSTVPSPPAVFCGLTSLTLAAEGRSAAFHRPLSNESLHTLFYSANLAPHLQSLTLSSCNLQSIDGITIARGFDSSREVLPALQYLSLYCNSIGPEGARALMKSRLAATPGFHTLDLRFNPFGEIAAELVELFCASTALRCLKLYPSGERSVLNRLRWANQARGSGFAM